MNDVALDICQLRGYYPERMLATLVKAGFLFIQEEGCYDKLKGAGSDLGLFSKEGKFLLEGRFIFPIRDMVGNVLALIGWFPDEKKYITTPSKFFSKSCLFYGLEQLSNTGINKNYVLVEGIFDSLSVRSLGIPCISQMGIKSSKYKQVMYSMFKSLLAIPDRDSEGKKVIEYDNWMLPSTSRYLRWVGDNSKDIDELCNSYEEEDVREMLKSSFKEKKKVVTIKI